MSLHADALAVLGTWAAPTAEQESLRLRYLTHLAAHPDGMRRGCFPDHLTAGTLVVDETGTQVLLNLHRKARRWFAFGGHCEPGDASLAGAARREAMEESGLADLRFDPVPAHLDEHAVGFCDPRGEVHHLDVRYVAQAPAGRAARDQRRVARRALVAGRRPAGARAGDARADRDRPPAIRLSGEASFSPRRSPAAAAGARRPTSPAGSRVPAPPAGSAPPRPRTPGRGRAPAGAPARGPARSR